jgi:hypothetical protein
MGEILSFGVEMACGDEEIELGSMWKLDELGANG